VLRGSTWLSGDLRRRLGARANAAFDRAEGLARRWATAAVRETLGPRGLWDGYFTRMLEGAGVGGRVAAPAAKPVLEAALAAQGR